MLLKISTQIIWETVNQPIGRENNGRLLDDLKNFAKLGGIGQLHHVHFALICRLPSVDVYVGPPSEALDVTENIRHLVKVEPAHNDIDSDLNRLLPFSVLALHPFHAAHDGL